MNEYASVCFIINFTNAFIVLQCDASNSPIVELCLSGVEKKEVAVDASHIGTITEPECLGPCEPGTSVTLEGIVWNETENGV